MKQNFRNWILTVPLVALVFVSCSKAGDGSASPDLLPNNVILEWNENAYEAFGGKSYLHSLMASRINAMVHLAMHDALNAIEEKYERYAFAGSDEEADPIAAAASAAHAVLLSEIPEKKNFLDSALTRSLGGLEDGEAEEKGIALGKAAAAAVLEMRKNDGSAVPLTVPVPGSGVAGIYQAVPPFNFMFVPAWENLKLFSIKSKDQFRCPPPPALTSDQYTIDFNEIKSFGGLKSTRRNAEQLAYARFWYEFSEAGWNRVARVVAAGNSLGLMQTARLFALVDMALADAYIGGWDSKLHYNFWRPYTAVRHAGRDGNEFTIADTSWLPAQPTPPIHDYPSTHSALGNAAAAVMAEILGNNTSFSFTSPTAVPGSGARSFRSFSQAADENADSRVMAGLHFRFSCTAGQELGTKIGRWTVANHLKPLEEGEN